MSLSSPYVMKNLQTGFPISSMGMMSPLEHI
nr:MAG TPA: hypothetical protein [Caudoviricetes sp.]